MKRLHATILTALLALSLPLALAQQPTEGFAAVRVAHLADGGPTVDVLVDGEVVLSGVSAGTISGYLLVPAGDLEVEIVVAEDAAPEEDTDEGAAPGEETGAAAEPADENATDEETGEETDAAAQPSGEALISETLTVEAGNYYTVAATLPALNGEEAAPGEETGAAAQEGDADAVEEGEEADTQEGEEGDADADAVEEGEETGAAAQPADDTIQLTVIEDVLDTFPAAGEALVRVVHASPDAPAVDIVAMEEAPLDDVDDNDVDNDEETPGEETGAAAAPADEETDEETDDAAPADDETDDAAPADEEAEGDTLFEGLEFGSASEYAAVPAAVYQLQVVADGQPVIELTDVALEFGVVYTFYAIGSVNEGTLSVVVSVDALVARELTDTEMNGEMNDDTNATEEDAP